jgi:hypothetical protein
MRTFTLTDAQPTLRHGRQGRPGRCVPVRHRQRTVGLKSVPASRSTPRTRTRQPRRCSRPTWRCTRASALAGRPTPARQSGLVSVEKRRTRRERNPRGLSLRAGYRGHEQGPPPRPSGPGARALIGHLERPLVDPPFAAPISARQTSSRRTGARRSAVSGCVRSSSDFCEGTFTGVFSFVDSAVAHGADFSSRWLADETFAA